MKALVLSGGGSKGSFQCGALSYILGEKQVKYDILCGISVGAINCAFLSMFHHGEEKKSAQILSEMWKQLDTSKIYQRWQPFGRWHSLWKKSFYDSSPLKHLIKSAIDLDKIKSTGKIVTVGAVSITSGEYKIFNQNSSNFIDAVIASASFPGMLEPIGFDGQLWTDGGVKQLSPITTAINLGADDIDVIITSPLNKVKKFINNPSTVDILKRTIDLSTDKLMTNDVEKIEMHNQLVNAGASPKKYVKINILRPTYNLTDDLLDFNPKKIKEMFDRGYYDASRNYTT